MFLGSIQKGFFSGKQQKIGDLLVSDMSGQYHAGGSGLEQFALCRRHISPDDDSQGWIGAPGTQSEKYISRIIVQDSGGIRGVVDAGLDENFFIGRIPGNGENVELVISTCFILLTW
ncbi:hypothetical protein BH11VER1_BH11VER1_09760 [soil metagenome]